MKNNPKWSPEKIKAFGREINKIGSQVKVLRGIEDLEYLKKVKNLSFRSEILGRSLLFVSIDPFTWSVGVLALWVHLQLETTEIGHSALHGCWDGLEGAEKFYSSSFRWNTPVDEKSWKYEHNLLHHQYTNITGRDPDLNYGGLRISEQTPWMPYHFIQVAQFFWTAPFFMWIVGSHATGLTDLAHPKDSKYYAHILPDRKIKTIFNSIKRTAKKMIPYSLYHFVFLAGFGRSVLV